MSPDVAMHQFHSSAPITAQLSTERDAPRLPGWLVGNLNKDMLVLSGLDSLSAAVGDELVVRTVVEGEVIGFRTNVVSIVSDPVRLLLVTYPGSHDAVQLRKTTRINVFFPADVRADVGPPAQSGDVALLSGRMINISAGGCCISTKKPLNQGKSVHLSFQLPAERRVYSLEGLVLGKTPRNSVTLHRVQYADSPKNVPILSEIGRWVDQNAGYAVA